MKYSDFNQTIATLANIGVIAGIVFLSFELHQNNELMEQDARRTRSASTEETWTIIAQNRELASLFVKDRNGEPLDDVDSTRISMMWLRSLTSLQLGYQELPEEELAPMVKRYRYNFELFPSLVSTWQNNQSMFDEEFAKWLNENILQQ